MNCVILYRLSLTVCDSCFIFSTQPLTSVNSVKIRDLFNTLALLHFPNTGLNRPLELQEVEVPRMYRQSAHEGGEFVSLTNRSPLTPLNQEISQGLAYVRYWVYLRATVRKKFSENPQWQLRKLNPLQSDL
jgi:hypothetical protein